MLSQWESQALGKSMSLSDLPQYLVPVKLVPVKLCNTINSFLCSQVFFFFFQESFLKMQMPKIITKCIWKKPGKRQRSDTISKRNSKPIHTFSWIKNECLLMLLIIVIILFQLSQIPSQLFLFFENKLVPPGHEKWYSLI